MKSPTADLQLCSSPINGNAYRGVGSGRPVDEWVSRKLPPISPMDPVILAKQDPHFKNILGERHGRMLIYALLKWEPHGKSWWIGKCDCGRYEPRRAKNWRRRPQATQCGDCAGNRGPELRDWPS